MDKKFGLLFDMDGVIAHTNPHHKVTIKLLCEKYNKQVSDSFLEEKVYGNKEWIPEIFGDISADELQRLADEKELMFRDYYQKDLKATDGLIPFLSDMKAHDIPMAVATSAPLENADFILDGLEIRNYFSAILTSANVDKSKPDPEIYLKAASKLSLDAKDCIVLEDSLAGVKAGQAAGSKVIGLTTTHTAKELSHCNLTIENFEGLTFDKVASL
jgi:beta-phosphoglucomutase